MLVKGVTERNGSGSPQNSIMLNVFVQWYNVGSFSSLNTLRPRRNGRHFADDIFKRIFLNENIWILIKISLKFVPKGSINNIPALVQIMAWRRPGDKPVWLSEPMMVHSPTHICVTRPQWVKCMLSLHTTLVTVGRIVTVGRTIVPEVSFAKIN